MHEPVSEALWRSINEVPAGWGPRVATQGVFDGVHRGRVRLISRAVDLGRARGVPTVLVTFDPHPARVTGRLRDTATPSTPARRANVAQALGVDAVLVGVDVDVRDGSVTVSGRRLAALDGCPVALDSLSARGRL